MGCTVRAALYKRSALMPARSQREPAGSASASRWLRQHSASASRWLRSLAPCMHSATLRQRFALAPRSSSPQSALRAACCDPRCLHTGPLNPRCEAALRAAAVTVTACGSSRLALQSIVKPAAEAITLHTGSRRYAKYAPVSLGTLSIFVPA